jgi:hypothetical protein
MRKRKHGKVSNFKYHGVIIEKDEISYQVIHQTKELTYAIPIGRKGLVGGGVERFKR